jgi:aryl-alcohol dehydrogenase-like predicted oxidoreductase
MRLKRREFLEGAAAGAGGLLLGGRLAAAGKGQSANYDPYEPVRLGKTALKVTRVGLGTGVHAWMRRSNHTRMGPKRFDALVRAVWERGIRLFDAADLYGTHPHLARALAKAPRDKLTLVSKVWLQNKGLPEGEPAAADVCVERFCKELKTDYIDIVLLHGVMDADWPKLRGDEMERLTGLKKKGVIRALGVAVHSLAALKAAVAEPWAEVVLARINPYGVNMDDKPDKVVPVLRKLHGAGKGVVAMKVLGAGKLAGDGQRRRACIRFVLGLDCVDAMVVGFERPAEEADFAAEVRKVPRRQPGERRGRRP